MVNCYVTTTMTGRRSGNFKRHFFSSRSHKEREEKNIMKEQFKEDLKRMQDQLAAEKEKAQTSLLTCTRKDEGGGPSSFTYLLYFSLIECLMMYTSFIDFH